MVYITAWRVCYFPPLANAVSPEEVACAHHVTCKKSCRDLFRATSTYFWSMGT